MTQSHASLTKRTQLQSEAMFQWPVFTADDLRSIDGKRDTLIRLLENCCGFARRRAEIEADLFLRQFDDKLKRTA